MRRILTVAVAAGLMAGAVMAPAQAEEQEPLPVLPCVDFTAEFTDGMNSSFGEIVQQKSEGTVFTGTIEALSSAGSVVLPPLRIGVPEPTESVPSVFSDKPDPVFGCDYYNSIQINYAWLSRSDDFVATLEEGKGISFPSRGCADERADDCRQMGMRTADGPDSTPNSWMVFSPALTVEDYGQYVNIGEFWMDFSPEWTTQKQAKTTEVSYTVTVLPPSAGNDLPEVPDEPAGISDGYDFGNVEIYDYKRGVAKITNIGTEGLVVRKAEIVDADDNEAPEFSTTGTDCIGRVIEPGRKCEVQVQYFPREQGSRAAILKVSSNADGPLEIPLVGVGTYTKPESVVEAEKEAEANGTKPVYEVAEPEKVEVAAATTKNGKSVVDTKKNKIKVKWKAPDTDQPVTGYEIRSKFKKKSWKKWKDVDPMPNKKGWIKASVKAKKSGNYKIQVTSSTPWVERGDKTTVKIKKK